MFTKKEGDNMLYSYQECILKYQSDYQIRKAIKKGKLFQLSKGIYSELRGVSDLEIFAKKYPNAIVTMNSAFYYYGLTDTIPQYSYLATDRDAAKIKDSKVKQSFLPKEVLKLGVVSETQSNFTIKIYSKERMLVELVRYKSKLSYDYYKEIIGNYRKLIYKLDIQEVQEIANAFPTSDKINQIILDEVF